MNPTPKVLTRLAQLVALERPDDPLPARMCRACARVLGAGGAALTLANNDPERLVLFASDERAARLEDLQEVLGEGPSSESYQTGQLVEAQLGTAAPSRWPHFAEAARQAFGPLDMMAVPIHPDAEVLGVLTLYQDSGQRLLYGQTTCQLLADSLGAALLHSPELAGRDLDDHSADPWTDRARVHQATGMVVAQLAVRADDAMALLRAHAFAHGSTLGQIAEQVLARDLDFTRTDAEVDRDTDSEHHRESAGETGDAGGAGDREPGSQP